LVWEARKRGTYITIAGEYRARRAFKLLEINHAYGVLSDVKNAVDLGRRF
jgi:23S rRNA U2552 (ribose-2'-O)-methylase RlmE/FtsJ